MKKDIRLCNAYVRQVLIEIFILKEHLDMARPEILFPIFSTVKQLTGIGPRLTKIIESFIGSNIVNLFWHLPTNIIDRRRMPKICDTEEGSIVTLIVTIKQHITPRVRRLPHKVICFDETNEITLIFFNNKADYLLKLLPIGETRVISGKIDNYDAQKQMTHPDHIGSLKDKNDIAKVEPIYPLTHGLSGKILAKTIKQALVSAPKLNEWIDKDFIKQKQWPKWNDALLQIHNPTDLEGLEFKSAARSRLAYDELLANQLALSLTRCHLKEQSGQKTIGNGTLVKKAYKNIPYILTTSQEKAINQISEDMSSSNRMHRLLQGDVGSGKTIVALFSMLQAVENGSQAVIMAPTEILARQHLETIKPLALILGIKIQILTSKEKGKLRDQTLRDLKTGMIDITVGTHAIFQEKVEFKDLRLVIIDEQHRFGVHQRLALTSKGKAVDLLVMTATPIPRTLTLTVYGDMDISRLIEKPAGRKPIDTLIVSNQRFAEVILSLKRALINNKRIYWVCPLVQESENIDVAAAEERFTELIKTFGSNVVGLVHGKMPPLEKENAMQDFKLGKTKLLVATTVIEVGVDVPEATIMIIEHAERFGLSQLHQLRGRIGRGAQKSVCILMYSEKMTKTAKKRLEIIRRTEDGFEIADLDLKLRGAGELLGTRQSGLPEFKLADLTVHSNLMEIARKDASLILAKDRQLKSKRGKLLRVLLYLFEKENAIKLLKSG